MGELKEWRADRVGDAYTYAELANHVNPDVRLQREAEAWADVEAIDAAIAAVQALDNEGNSK